jgi:lipopolysaccharide transport system permease protein
VTESGSVAPSQRITIRRPSERWALPDLLELWNHRDLVYFLTWRDVVVRYRQAVLGVGWAVIQPVVTMVVFSVVFGGLAKLPSGGVPYPLLTLAALLPWNLFSGGVQRAGMSLVGNSALLTKVYLPKLVIPLSAVLAGLVDFTISVAVLVVMMLYYRTPISWAILAVPALVALTITIALAVGLWLSAINVQYRDVQQAIPFLLQVWLYVSPVAYSAKVVPAGPWRVLYMVNPMVGVIDGVRWSLFGGEPPGVSVLVSVGVTALVLASGLLYFRRTESSFADVV